MIPPKTAPASPDEVVDVFESTASSSRQSRREARLNLARYRAETDRLRVLMEFLGRPIHAHGGPDPDADILSAYNLAVEAALKEVRRASLAL